MPRPYRLTRSDFLRLSTLKGRKFHGEFFNCSLFLLPSDMHGPKSACVVSKKVSTRAVDRNRIERRCRSVVQKHIAKVAVNAAIVFYAKKDAVKASFEAIKKDMGSLFERIREQGTMR